MGVAVTLLTQIVKWFYKRTGSKEMTKAAIIVLTSILALGGALAYTHVPPETLETWAKTWMIAVGFYQVGYKRVIAPALKYLDTAIENTL